MSRASTRLENIDKKTVPADFKTEQFDETQCCRVCREHRVEHSDAAVKRVCAMLVKSREEKGFLLDVNSQLLGQVADALVWQKVLMERGRIESTAMLEVLTRPLVVT